MFNLVNANKAVAYNNVLSYDTSQKVSQEEYENS